MKKGIAVMLSLVLVGGAAAGVYYYWFKDKNGTSSERVSSDSENAVYVDSVSVLAGLGSGTGLIQRFSGVVEPQQTLDVKLENERTVKECYVKEGDEVKEGQKLFTYDTTDDEDKLAQAEIDLERCQNDIDTAKARKEQLEKEKAKASSDEQLNYTTLVLEQETTIKKSEYEYKSKQLEIEQLKSRIDNATVNSDIAGVIKSINDPNSSSTNSDGTDSAYITVLALGDYRIKGTVNEQNISQVYDGMEMLVHSRVDDTLTWKGTITEINRDKGESSSSSSYYDMGSSDSGSSSTNYPFYIELESSDNLMLGQHVYMEPDLGQADAKEGIWLDDYYFMTAEDGTTSVWAAASNNTLEQRQVTLGDYDEDLMTYQVLEGLSEEDYITVPSDELTAGLPVIYNDASLDDGSTSMDGMDYSDAGMDYSDTGMDYSDTGMDIPEDGTYEDLGEDVDGTADGMMTYDDSMSYDDSSVDELGADDSMEVYDADADELEGAGADEAADGEVVYDAEEETE